MSEAELARVGALRDVAAGRLAMDCAAALMGVSRRQAFRLLRRFREGGAAALASRRRGRPSDRRLPEAVRAAALAAVRERYAYFGPTLAAEKLASSHGVTVPRETLRKWMMAEGLWADRKARAKPVHQPRGRRDCLGELVQIDGSRHWWFEDCGPPCTLLVFIDDATSRLMHPRSVLGETAFDHFRAVREYLDQHGKPAAFQSDRHSVSRAGKAAAGGGGGMTRSGRPLHEPGIDIPCANSPLANGPVERAHEMPRDRLAEEPRLRGIATIDAVDAAFRGFVADRDARSAEAQGRTIGAGPLGPATAAGPCGRRRRATFTQRHGAPLPAPVRVNPRVAPATRARNQRTGTRRAA